MYIKTKGIEAYNKYIEGHKIEEDIYLKDLNGSIKSYNDMIMAEDIISSLNKNNTKLMPDKENDILIIFENFSNFDYFVDAIKKYITRDKPHHNISYNPSKNLILTRRNFLNSKNGILPGLKSFGLDDSEIINFTLLHEIGHSIHDTINRNGSPFINIKSSEADFINNFTNSMSDTWYTSSNPLMRKINNTIAEGFADLYSIIVINKLYPIEQAENITNALLHVRHKDYDPNYEHYNTFDSIMNFVNKNKHDSNFMKNYQDIETFIFNTTLSNTYKMLEEEMNITLNNTYNKHMEINHFAGVLYESYNLEAHNINPNVNNTLKYISNNLGFKNNFTNKILNCSLNKFYEHKEDAFQMGREEYKEINTPKKNKTFSDKFKIFKRYYVEKELEDTYYQKNSNKLK